MSTPTAIRPEVEAFAAAVRDALGDLPPEEIDDLTDGLEADLTERADDATPGEEGFGDPADYAAELRAAAGLPASTSRSRRPGEGIADSLRTAHRKAVDAARSTPFGAGLLDALIALRPAWWVLRAWALYQVISELTGTGSLQVLPYDGSRWVVFLVLLTVSVQWGRGRWMPVRGLRVGKTVLSAVAAVLLVVLIPQAVDASATAATRGGVEVIDTSPPGLNRDDEAIGNIFAYDRSGEPLTGVQLFDETGRPLDLVGGDDSTARWWSTYDETGERIVVPSDAVPGRVGWNVYPLSVVPVEDTSAFWEGEADDLVVEAEAPEPPFARVQPLAGDGDESDAGPSPSPAAPSVSEAPTVPEATPPGG